MSAANADEAHIVECVEPASQAGASSICSTVVGIRSKGEIENVIFKKKCLIRSHRVRLRPGIVAPISDSSPVAIAQCQEIKISSARSHITYGVVVRYAPHIGNVSYGTIGESYGCPARR